MSTRLLSKSTQVVADLPPSRFERPWPSRRFWFAFLATAMVFFSLVRWRLREMPLQRDEGEYAYTAQLFLKGIPPYQLAYSMKFPGTSVAYAAIISTFGQTAAGIHTGLLVLNAITALLVFILALRFFELPAATMAGVSYLVLSTSRAVMGLQGHATHFVVFFAFAGLYVLLKALDRSSNWLIWSSGCLLGVGLLMKQHGIFFSLFCFFFLLYRQAAKRTPKSAMLSTLCILVLGVASPFVLTVVVLSWYGTLDKFWFWTFQYAHAYATAQTWGSTKHLLGMKLHSVTHSLEGFWFLAAIGLFAAVWDRQARKNAPFFIGFFLFSFLAVCPGFLFRGHYFILLLPAVSLLVGVALDSGERSARQWASSRQIHIAPWLIFGTIFLLTLFYSLIGERRLLFQIDPISASREFFGFPEAEQAADLVRLSSKPGARVVVLGSEPEIYFYADRLSATGYLYTYPLMERHPYASVMQREMIKEIEQGHPDFLVVVFVRDSWGRQAHSDGEILDWADGYIENNYHIIGSIASSADSGGGSTLLYVLQVGHGFGDSKPPKLSDLPASEGAE